MRYATMNGTGEQVPVIEKGDLPAPAQRPVMSLREELIAQDELNFELPAKQCDIGRPEGCESCQ